MRVVRRIGSLILFGAICGVLLLWNLVAPRDAKARSPGVLLRQFLENMGFGFVKLGQFLALRFDLLPSSVCDELAKLFDSVRPLPVAAIRRVVEAELSCAIDDRFAEFSQRPLAAASLAQVHEAVTRDGMKVVLKVQRPGAVETFQADMVLARAIAWLVDVFGILGERTATSLIDEFIDFTRREMDFVAEGRATDRARSSGTSDVHIPSVRRDLSTSRLLVLEHVDGLTLNAILEMVRSGRREELERALPGVSLQTAMQSLIAGILEQVMINGVFHADPHRGNVLIRRDGTVWLVDFGLFGYLTPSQRRLCANYARNLALGNFEASFRSYIRLLAPTQESDTATFMRETVAMSERWYEANRTGYPPQNRHMGSLILATFDNLRRFRVRIDTNLLLFWRMMYVLDSTALSLDCGVDTVRAVRKFFDGHLVRLFGSPAADSTGLRLPDFRLLAAARRGLRRNDGRLEPERLGTTRAEARPERLRARTRVRLASALLIAVATVLLLVGDL